MNCKPGDRAIIVPPSKNAGSIVEIMYLSVDKHFTGLPSWVVSPFGGSMTYRLPNGQSQTAQRKMARIPDAWVRPVSGLPLNEETPDEVTA